MTAGPVVIDASVAVEYLVKIRYAEQATRLFRHLLDDDSVELWSPDLIYTEAVSALRKLVRIKALSPRDGAAVVEHLVHLPITIAGTASLMSEVWKLQNIITAYDACYVALARSLNAPLITADQKLVKAMSRTDDRVIGLERL